ncbi:MAG: dienelactone hydrolase family protein, partial [Candidatus Aminicenantales bacterium]
MDPKIAGLYEEFQRGVLDRRDFLAKLARLAGGTAAAAALLPLLEGRSEASQLVPKDDPGLRTEYIKYAGAAGDIRAYSARPKDAKKKPGVVVIHENR